MAEFEVYFPLTHEPVEVVSRHIAGVVDPVLLSELAGLNLSSYPMPGSEESIRLFTYLNEQGVPWSALAFPPSTETFLARMRLYIDNLNMHLERISNMRSTSRKEHQRGGLEDLQSHIQVMSVVAVNHAKAINYQEAIATRVPPEVICMFTLFAADTDPPRSGQPSPYFNTLDRRYLGWLVIIHTCSHWRQSVLPMKHLFGRTYTHFPMAAPTFEKLAGDTPLYYEVSKDVALPIDATQMYSHTQHVLLSRLMRFTTFQHCASIIVNWRGPVIEHVTRLSACSPLPKLKYLCVSVRDPFNDLTREIQRRLLENHFGHGTIYAPNLVELVAINCFFGVVSNSLEKITYEMRADGGEHPSLSQFIDVLQGSSTESLTSIQLRRVFLPFSEVPPPTSFIGCPVLEHLDVEDWSENVDALFSRISWTNATSPVITIPLIEGEVAIELEIPRTFEVFDRARLSWDTLTVVVVQHDGHCFDIAFSFSKRDGVPFGHHEEAEYSVATIIFTISGEESWMQRVLDAALGGIDRAPLCQARLVMGPQHFRHIPYPLSFITQFLVPYSCAALALDSMLSLSVDVRLTVPDFEQCPVASLYSPSESPSESVLSTVFWSLE